MKKVVRKIRKAAVKSSESIKTEGLVGFSKRSAKFVYYKKYPERKKKQVKDILFINGCALPHPARYRVDHQVEQLLASGLSVDKVFYEHLNSDDLKYYRGFVFFRCPITDTVREFIQVAKKHNKTCFFDVDDLVIDTKYTDRITYVQNMPPDEKSLYDDGVNRMKETLQLCDYAITTTERLQTELKKYTKDVFINRNVASDEMVACANTALKSSAKDKNKVVIGYFSGSITHNEDFEMVLPSLVKLLKKHDNLYLKIAGILDIPAELEPFRDRLINIEFMDWRIMPKEIASCDINIAPLTNTIFNEAKSENKWTEASLVKIPTLASNIGAFKKVIKPNKNGVLVNDDEWFTALDDLIKNPKKREEMGCNAYTEVTRNTTIYTAAHFSQYIKSKLSRNIGFVLPSTDISGGVNVTLKHAEILQKQGWDVTLFDSIDKAAYKKSKKSYDYRDSVDGLLVVTMHKVVIKAHFDTMVATLWATLKYVKGYPNVKNKLYFVQGMETDFSPPGWTTPRLEANATYMDDTGVRYITMSLWCKKWLKEDFNKEAKYCSNGIEIEYYKPRTRDFSKPKIKILIEGDSHSELKNTDEAFRIVEKLDPKRFEISYLSYRKEPKPWYRVDRFYNRIPSEKVGEVYASCDILLKTSILESFSYPPLEMMATGGVAVVIPNDGNQEYLQDEENCLFYKRGNIEDGVRKIEHLLEDKKLRDKLIKNGLKTAKSYAWENLEDDVVKLYE